MKFTVNSVGTSVPNCNFRSGRLSEIGRIPNTVLLTPLLLLYSKGGSVTHLTREVLDMVTNISSQMVQIPLANSEQCFNGLKNFKKGIANFTGLNECLSYCTVQDPAEETKVGYNEKNLITIWTHTGRKQLTPDKYMDIMEAFRPDMYHVLCDGDTNKASSRKRGQKAVGVTTNMFFTCLERHAKSESLKQSSLLAVLEGGYNLEARQEAAILFSRHPQVEGFVIDGLHNNGPSVEQMTYDTIQPVITETMKHLPEDKLRVVHGGWRPDVVLELVRAGVDVFDSSLVYMVTERGCALTFTYKVIPNLDVTITNGANGFTSECNQVKEEAKCSEIANKAVKKGCESISNYEINLKDTIYFDDFSPISRECKCLACTKHTRAYIHHLLNTREMLASVLLMIHNLHHYERFFQAIRESGRKGEFLTIDPPIS